MGLRASTQFSGGAYALFGAPASARGGAAENWVGRGTKLGARTAVERGGAAYSEATLTFTETPR
jgi:hypothetical protein